jgi:hypothetical protein
MQHLYNRNIRSRKWIERLVVWQSFPLIAEYLTPLDLPLPTATLG